ncbi:hypothetical protein E4T56_gene13790 [Termitomyces sp. T112]|nr:hypothetical protein E4T56_gene13790 [Termitomyces sp. T112]
MLTVTFIRHGESEDNTKDIWAGWKDAPLSPLGTLQVSALARFFHQSQTHFDHIYVSPLLRAQATGKAIHDLQPHDVPFTILPKLREQHFGCAEGNMWAYDVAPGETRESMIASGVYPVPLLRSDKFEGGESLDDLAVRAEEAMRECVLPHVGEEDVHIAVTSHGLCISELVKAVLRLDPDADHERDYTGLLNTAWTRITVEPREGNEGLNVKVTDVNRSEHLETVSSSVASSDVNTNSDARAFFGGKTKSDTSTVTPTHI